MKLNQVKCDWSCFILVFDVLYLAKALFDTVTACIGWLVISEMRKNFMTFFRVAALLARLTYPINVACLAGVVVISLLALLLEIDRHAF